MVLNGARRTSFPGRSGTEYRKVGRSIVPPKGRSGPPGSVGLHLEEPYEVAVLLHLVVITIEVD